MMEDARPTVAIDTANQYVSHLLYALKRFQLIGDDEAIRSDLSHKVYRAYQLDFHEHVSERDVCTIPMTFPLLAECIARARTTYSGLLRLAVPAALGCAFACSFRPGEYARTDKSVDWPYMAIARQTYGWYNQVAYRADMASEWPATGYPGVITITKDSRKRKVGRAGPFVIFPNPNSSGPICIVRLLTDYIRQANLTRFEPLFVDVGRRVLHYDVIRAPVAAVATRHGFDPRRMSLQCLRYGVNVQLPETMPEFVRVNQGGWSSKQAERHYWLQLFAHGRATQPSVYDAQSIPSALVENIFSRPPGGPPKAAPNTR
jgi:hypothetical protein